MALAQDVSRFKGRAVRFVILLGVVSLLSDLTYEGARSINGPFLALLGANAAVVATVAGLGEFIGYALRLVSGYVTEVTRRYWAVTIIGYAVNLLAVPLLALAGRWEIAVALMLAERLGKAIRTPARDAMLAQASFTIGRGWGFGLHEALDQIGALAGPLVVAMVLALQGRGGYPMAYALLLIPAVLALSALGVGWWLYPQPQKLEVQRLTPEPAGLPRRFWLYLVAVALIAAGFADYPLIAFHFLKTGVLTDTWIPVIYAIAMGSDAIAALILGAAFDRFGLRVMVVATLLAAFFAPLVFWGGFSSAVGGMIFWGIGLGAQESVMRAALAELVPPARRASAYGILQAGYGCCWFFGSLLMGLIYDWTLVGLVTFSVCCQLLAGFFFIFVSSKLIRVPLKL